MLERRAVMVAGPANDETKARLQPSPRAFTTAPDGGWYTYARAPTGSGAKCPRLARLRSAARTRRWLFPQAAATAVTDATACAVKAVSASNLAAVAGREIRRPRLAG